jgi:hypothetical protein
MKPCFFWFSRHRLGFGGDLNEAGSGFESVLFGRSTRAHQGFVAGMKTDVDEVILER